MTRPRRHVEEQVAMMTRRCLDRKFLLRADDTMNAIANYEVARSAERSGVSVHGVVVMSNHVHIVVTDPKAKRSAFMRDAMAGFARARNADLGRRGYFWDEGPYCDTVLLDHEAMEEKLLYTFLNPVLSELVDRVEEWPGFMIRPADWEQTVKVPRPQDFYSKRQPEFIEFKAKRPPGYDHMTLEELVAYFERRIKEKEDELIAAREREKRRVAGIADILAKLPTFRPATESEAGGIRPRFASKNPEVMRAAIERERAFYAAYTRQRERWVQGKKRVVFPSGTLWLKQNAPVKCQERDPTEAGLAPNMRPACGGAAGVSLAG
ncbi:hypothetical protein FRC98_16935 [Lujinxingia vulgaris]|uniref:Transposase IS200-like domain-containing protein n=1 Tax=Lujinxingia vulgaris TaxID=2600176 RepID=A0A5C6XAS8_9DELT|nr:hypothetical protein [Lujinxingia vulgaris]TXD35156.1 hypothetical protein FRC98_16935 [Lujinxingia vulgaris]